MDAAVIAKMRAAMYATQPVVWPGVAQFFRAHPPESNEVFGALFDERNAHVPHSEEPLHRLIAMKVASIVEPPDLAEARRQRNALDAAYAFPPTCQRMLMLALGGVVHAGEPSATCEALVREHPDVARALVAQLVKSQAHPSFFGKKPGPERAQEEIHALRAMLARCALRQHLNQMGARNARQPRIP